MSQLINDSASLRLMSGLTD